jgi:hypothetical protein
VIPLAFAALLLPGLAWWAWLGERREDPLVSLAKIVGVGMSVIILLAGGGFILGVEFSRLTIILLLVIFALLALDGLLRRGVRLQRRYRPYVLVGLFLLGMAIAWRLYQARDLLLPAWVDSQHHYLIVRVILEEGGLPHDLSPYLPVPFYYHYGFHALAALFTALSGLPIGDAMLLLGQVLNAAIGLSTYALGKTLWRNWRPALAAALLVSFATRMPAYYLSWGRYTLTVGMILLPLAMGLALEICRGKVRWGSTLTLALLTAGILLSHYFAALLLAVFLVLLVLVHLVQGRRRLPQAFMQVSWLINSALAGLLMAAPWLWRVAHYSASRPGIDSNLPESLEMVITGGGGNYVWQLLGPASNHWLLLPAGLGLVIALILQRRVSFALWSLALAALALPWGLALRPFRPDHFAIVLFTPITLLGGWLLWLAARWVGGRLKRRWVTAALLGFMVTGWIAWGFPKLRNIVNPVTVMVTAADIDALDWVAENTPEDARFFINTAHWQGGVYRGVDGGGWLLPYTGRWALVPTVFYGFSPDAAYIVELRDWGQAASQVSTCSEDFWRLVEEAELDWVYLRTGVGSLQPGGLAGCEGIAEAYRNEEVFIFSVKKN